MRAVITLQMVYYLITALWPLFHFKSFELIFGQKKENWLVYTVSVLLLSYCATTAINLSLNHEPSFEIIILSVFHAIGLILIDVIFVVRKKIRNVYLGDAFVQFILLGLIIFSWAERSPSQ